MLFLFQIYVEKNLCGENLCGEKMTNMRSVLVPLLVYNGTEHGGSVGLDLEVNV